jgi:hypothetical protein
MSKLIAKDPMKVEATKPKFVLYGPSGVGKTWFALDFPSVYYIDTEGGASRSHYMERLKNAGGSYIGPTDGACDFDTVIGQIKALATEKHHYKTVVIDSITKIFNSAVAAEAERLGDKNAFGADKKAAIAQMRRLVAAADRLDMNVVFVAHEKAEWGQDDKGQRVETGKVEDCWEKLRYELDIAFQVQKRGPRRVASVRKSRLLGFPEGETFDLDFDTFASRYGKDVIEKNVETIVTATDAQVSDIVRLVDLIKLPETEVAKFLTKARAESWSEMSTQDAQKFIVWLQKKIGATTN